MQKVGAPGKGAPLKTLQPSSPLCRLTSASWCVACARMLSGPQETECANAQGRFGRAPAKARHAATTRALRVSGRRRAALGKGPGARWSPQLRRVEPWARARPSAPLQALATEEVRKGRAGRRRAHGDARRAAPAAGSWRGAGLGGGLEAACLAVRPRQTMLGRAAGLESRTSRAIRFRAAAVWFSGCRPRALAAACEAPGARGQCGISN